MNCLYCGGELAVTNSRPQKRSNQVWRRRQCQRCLAIFTTHEAVEAPSALRVVRSNTMEPFLPDKLYTEVLLSLQDRKNPYVDARELCSTILQELIKLPASPVFDTKQISKTVAMVLKRFDKRASLRYRAEHPSLL